MTKLPFDDGMPIYFISLYYYREAAATSIHVISGSSYINYKRNESIVSYTGGLFRR